MQSFIMVGHKGPEQDNRQKNVLSLLGFSDFEVIFQHEFSEQAAVKLAFR